MFDFIVYVSSRNNYDMLENEVIRNVFYPNIIFVNVDDGSCEKEKSKGMRICKENNIPFIENEKRGLQWATKSVVNYAKKNHPNVKFLIHFQHDNYPMFIDFYTKFQRYIDSGFLDEFGTIGFNILDIDGRNTKKSYKLKKDKGKDVLGMCGVANLEESKAVYYCNNHISMDWKIWGNPFAVESVMWCCLAINIELFEKYIDVTDKYHLHLWGADICYQFCKNNIYNVALPDLYVTNHMALKSKYDISSNSAKGSKGGDEYHFGHNNHHSIFRERFGFCWKDSRKTFAKVKNEYKETLLYKFFNHNIKNGPLKTWDMQL
jgi:hypothetical protein